MVNLSEEIKQSSAYARWLHFFFFVLREHSLLFRQFFFVSRRVLQPAFLFLNSKFTCSHFGIFFGQPPFWRDTQAERLDFASSSAFKRSNLHFRRF